jgi:hypothetical protein
MFTIMVRTFLFVTWHQEFGTSGSKKQKPRFAIAASAESLSFFYCFGDWLRFCTSAANGNQKRLNRLKVVNRVIEILNAKVSNSVSFISGARTSLLGLLLQRASNLGECVIGVGPNQTYGADDQYQDDGEHDGIFGNVLSCFVPANIAKELNHRTSGGKLVDTIMTTWRAIVNHKRGWFFHR